MSQKTGMVLIVIAVILLNLWLMGNGNGGGRGSDYQEIQRYDERDTESYP